MNCRFLLIILTLVGFLISCDNDFEINAPKEEIPIVYGLLDPNESDHVLRLERAFINTERSALEIAKDPDSIYYANASVILRTELGREITMARVDAADLGLPRREGVFAETPNFVYTVPATVAGFTENELVMLEIQVDELSDPITASTSILAEIDVRLPSFDRPLVIRPGDDFRVRWNHDNRDMGRAYQVNLEFFFTEVLSTGERIDRVIDIDLGSTTDEKEINVQSDAFYSALAALLDPIPGGVREIGDVRITVIAGGEELSEAINLENANTGLTSNQEIPVFTNLSSGRGIFSSRTSGSQMYNINTETRDSIRDGRLTGDLGFL